MIKFLSSMRFAFWSLVSLIIWLFVGSLLTLNQDLSWAIKNMGNQLILDWLIEESKKSEIVLIWFIILCLIGLLLAISFIFCSWNNLLKIARKQLNAKTILLLIIHIFFVTILGLHLGSMLIGYKCSNIELSEGQSFHFNNNLSIKLNKVNYVDDINVLKMKYKEMRKYHSPQSFHYKENYADITLFQDKNVLANKQIRMLDPLKYGSLRATLSYFYLPKNTNDERPGIKLVITKNYFDELFFIFYAIEILSILVFIVLTWKYKSN